MNLQKYPILAALLVLSYAIYDAETMLVVTLAGGLFTLPRYLTIPRIAMAYVPLLAFDALILSWNDLMADLQAWFAAQAHQLVGGQIGLAWIGGAAVVLMAGMTLFRKFQGEAGGRTYLDVPYEESGFAKENGAWWDEDRKQWYAPRGAYMPDLKRWMM